MIKTFTARLTINNLASKANLELLNYDSAFDFETEFTDVYEVLNDLSVDVHQKLIDKIIRAVSEYK